jgi:integrase/recombinase XerD
LIKWSTKNGAEDQSRTDDTRIFSSKRVYRLLHKLSVTEIAELSNTSKSYVSQVKHGKCPPSRKLLTALAESPHCKKPDRDYLRLFLESRKAMGLRPRSVDFYRSRISLFADDVEYWKATRQDVERHLSRIPPGRNGLGNRHASFRALRAFYNWLDSEYGFSNPVANLKAPILTKVILPSLTKEQVEHLVNMAGCTRDRALIALLAESGLRLSELANIKSSDINWHNHTIKVMGKGRKEAYAPFGNMSAEYLRLWLNEFQQCDGVIWDINSSGIAIMLKRLRDKTGLPCNPHTFRRTFACLLRKAGVDCLMIRDLGRWESVQMVERYTRSVTFEDSLKFYKAPLG